MNLKPQTVYIEINGRATFEPKENQICLSKEELVELLGKAFVAGNERGWSGYPNTDNHTKPTKEQFINNLFNQ